MAPSHGFAAASHRERAPPRPANGGFHATYDVLLTPALATLPPKLGWVDMTMDGVHEYWRRVFHFSPFTVYFNLTGQPAIVLQLGRCDATPERTATGFPTAVPLVARYGDEATLFRLAAQLETRDDQLRTAGPLRASRAGRSGAGSQL